MGHMPMRHSNAKKIASVETKYRRLEMESLTQSGEFCGYACVFDEVDLGNDVIVRGAFSNTLKSRNAAEIRMLFQHDPNKPVGTWHCVKEDSHGLYVRGKICSDTQTGRELTGLLQTGALDGLSIGFKTVRAKKSENGNLRTILEVDLWEISIVTFPMQENARVHDVKVARIENELPTKREFENWLKRDVGLTRSEALAVIAKGYTSLLGKRDAATQDPSYLTATISQATRNMIASTRSARRR